MRNPEGKSRGFGFVTYEGKEPQLKSSRNHCRVNSDTSSVEEFMRSRPHTIDSRQIDPKRASKIAAFYVVVSHATLVFSATRGTEQFRSTSDREEAIRCWPTRRYQ